VGSLVLLAAQLIALSILFQVVMGVPYWVGSVLGGAVVIVYFTAGGLFSSAWINFLQLIVLGAGFLLSLPAALDSAGGWDEVRRTLVSRMSASGAANYLSGTGIGGTGILYYVALLAPSFIVSPGLIQKAFGARSAAAARLGVNLNAVALVGFALIPPALGIVAAAKFPGLADPQVSLFRVMTDALPVWLGVLGIAAIFSAEVSTCDAVLFMLSTSLSVDLYKGYLHRTASDRRLLLVSRATAVIAGALGVLISIRVPSIIASLTLFYSLVSVALFVPVVMGLYSSRPTARGALAAICTSVPATLILHYGYGDVILGTLNPFLIGMAISWAVLWVEASIGARHRSR
jgi:SSS family solute:Na+ symporter